MGRALAVCTGMRQRRPGFALRTASCQNGSARPLPGSALSRWDPESLVVRTFTALGEQSVTVPPLELAALAARLGTSGPPPCAARRAQVREESSSSR